MARYTQAAVVDLLSHALVSADSISVGAASDVAGLVSASVYFWHAWVQATSIDRGVDYYLQGTPEAAGNRDWVTLAKFTTGTETANEEALEATEPVSETVMAVALTTGFTTFGDLIYIKDGSVVTDSEWHQIRDFVTDTSVTLFDGLAVGKTSSDSLFSHAERFVAHLNNLAGLSRVRAIAHNHDDGNDSHSMVKMLVGTDFE